MNVVLAQEDIIVFEVIGKKYVISASGLHEFCLNSYFYAVQSISAETTFVSDFVYLNSIILNSPVVQARDLPGDDSDSDLDDEEEFDLRDVSSDVEIDPEELEIPSDDERFVTFSVTC